ncbi:MAG: thiamine phosphate synthase [Thermomicrobiales bacterium]
MTFKLQAIVDGYRPLTEIEQVLDAGVDCLQVRIRSESTIELVEYVRDVSGLCRAKRVLLLVSGRLDVAMASGADGVQLGRGGLKAPEVRRIASGMFVGVSVHSVDEAFGAEQDSADAVTYGHIFATPSHPGEPPRGLDGLRSVGSAVGIPVVAIGGIGLMNVEAVREAGASGVAILGAIWNATVGERTSIVQRLDEGMNR